MIPKGTYAIYTQYDGTSSMQGIFTIENGEVSFPNKGSEFNLDFLFPSGKISPRSAALFQRMMNEEDPYHFIRKV